MTTFVPDTHALIWFLSSPTRLGKDALQAFRDQLAGHVTFYVPAIVIAEIIWVVRAGRVVVDIDTLLSTIRENYSITPFTADDALQLSSLSEELTIHDAMIVWEARKREAAIITMDETIRSYGQVSIVW